MTLQANFPTLHCRIIATDADENMLQRADRGCYPASSLRDLPPEWREKAFVPVGNKYHLQDQFRARVEFCRQDIRTEEQPDGPFYLALCRNLVLTYFEESLQRQVLTQIIRRLHPEGVLVTGKTERLPEGFEDLVPWFAHLGIYRKSEV
jgi:chemotaxis protein methyltransferase CheR